MKHCKTLLPPPNPSRSQKRFKGPVRLSNTLVVTIEVIMVVEVAVAVVVVVVVVPVVVIVVVE